MNIKQASKALNRTTRAVERYISQGRLTAHYKKETGKDHRTREVIDLDPKEVETLKAELEQPRRTIRPQVMHEQSQQEQTALAPVGRALDAVQQLVAVIDALEQQRGSAPAVLAELNLKLTLSLEEAAAISGLSKGFLTSAIHARVLKAAKRGRGWNIKRTDLDSYIKNLR
jgi:excisionase family DNA binding protein